MPTVLPIDSDKCILTHGFPSVWPIGRQTVLPRVPSPIDLPTDLQTEWPIGLPTDLPIVVPTDVPTDLPTDWPTAVRTGLVNQLGKHTCRIGCACR